MVKSIKSIITRVIIGVLIALILTYLKGGLISNVSAMEVWSYETNNNVNYASCSNCNLLNATWSNGLTPSFANTSGYLLLNAQVTTATSNTGFMSTLVKGLITVGEDTYTCSITGYGNNFEVYNTGGIQHQISTYSLTCPIKFRTSNASITKVYLQVNGSVADSISLYSPITYVYDKGQNEVVNAINENTEAQNETNDTLKSEDSPDTEGLFSDIDTDDSNSPVSDLITMPITLLQALNNNSSGSCTTWNLGTLLGKNLTMPCINIRSIVGDNLYNIIDMAICLFLAYNLGLMCVSIYNNLTSLNDDFDSMYAPKHEEHGKHGRVE